MCMFYFACCINIIFNSLLAQLINYDVHTTREIKFIHSIFYHILLLSLRLYTVLDNC